MTIVNGDWTPPAPPETPLADNVMGVDPRTDQTTHALGEGLPCPPNPPPPVGWHYWRGREVPAKAGQLALQMRNNPKYYPMGAFLQTYCNGELIGARVEWHSIQGATGKKGCFRGVSLYMPEPAPKTV